MNDKHCPNDGELLSFVDRDLPPEKLQRIDLHAKTCTSCARQIAALQELISDVAAVPPEPAFDVTGHVAGVMQRLDSPASKPTPAAPRSVRWALAGGAFAAAAAICLAVFTHGQDPSSGAEFAARGGPIEASLEREVGVQLYTQSTQTTPLKAGARIAAGAALTAGLRNLGERDVYLLLFAVDAKRDVHWIAPQYTVAGTDPEAARMAPGMGERLLPSAAVFDDLGTGPLRVMAVISRQPLHVSNVEQLAPAQLTVDGLRSRFPGTQVRQLAVEVTP